MPYEPHFTITPKILGNMMEIAEAITRKGYDGRDTVRLSLKSAVCSKF